MSEENLNLESEEKIAASIEEFVRDWANTYDWDEDSKIFVAIEKLDIYGNKLEIEDIHVERADALTWDFKLDGIIGEKKTDDGSHVNDRIFFWASGAVSQNEEAGGWKVDHVVIDNILAKSEDFNLVLKIKSAVESVAQDITEEPMTFTFPEKRLVSADEALSYISTLSKKLWYRGHANEEWKLETGIAREDKSSPALEKILRLAFENQTAFLDSSFHPPDTAKHIFLMQHHGLPTRLLDWTTSPLTALYFAVCHIMPTGKDTNACIWAMNPAQLNVQQKAPFPRELRESQDDFFTEEAANKVLAIHAPHAGWRMKMQQAEFTLHSDYKPLEEMPGAPVYLREKIIIPKGIKAELRGRLTVLGVTRAALFPDLDSIAQTIKDDILEKPSAADDDAVGENSENQAETTDSQGK